MNNDTIAMAREAGICTWLKPPEDVKERLERFAELVRAAEREACAKLAWTTPEPDDEYVPLRMAIHDAIRART